MLNQAQIDTVKSAKKVASFIEEFRKINPLMQAQQMIVFLLAASNPDITVTEIAASAGISTSAAGRHVAALGKSYKAGLPGYDIITTVPDASDARIKRVRLSPKGQRIMASLEGLL